MKAKSVEMHRPLLEWQKVRWKLDDDCIKYLAALLQIRSVTSTPKMQSSRAGLDSAI
jgi:hypothetical protein